MIEAERMAHFMRGQERLAEEHQLLFSLGGGIGRKSGIEEAFLVQGGRLIALPVAAGCTNAVGFQAHARG